MKKKVTKKTVHHRHHVAKPAEARSVISFEAKEFREYDKNQFWYFGIGLILVAILVPLIYRGEYLTALVVVAFGIAVFRISKFKANTKKIEFSDHGIVWGDRFYPFHQLKAFWLSDTGTHIDVYLERLNFTSSIHLLLPENRLNETAQFLSRYLPFHDHKNEPLGDKINRFLKI